MASHLVALAIVCVHLIAARSIGAGDVSLQILKYLGLTRSWASEGVAIRKSLIAGRKRKADRRTGAPVSWQYNEGD
ncbi:exported hypothetical protein [Hyphomicrobium sp. GJ21]|nr:exported hypothetical protein [Hyphomicrobium sp. GJ21]